MIKNFDAWINEQTTESSISLTEYQHYILQTFVSHGKNASRDTPAWTVNKQGLIDIDGSFYCGFSPGTSQPKYSKLYEYLKKHDLPPFAGLKFGTVTETFEINHCDIDSLEGIVQSVKSLHCAGNNLQTLEGCPVVSDSIICSGNKLASLKGSPDELLYFDCDMNPTLTTLEHGPRTVKQTYRAGGCSITTLKGGPEVVGSFYCNRNKLESLDGGPSIIETNDPNGGATFNCNDNNLKTLNGAPDYCNRFEIANNPTLKTLKGVENMKMGVGEYKPATTFSCSNCGLESLEYVPLNVFYLYCQNNQLLSLEGSNWIDINCSKNILSDTTLKLVYKTMKSDKCSWADAINILVKADKFPSADWNAIPSDIRNKLKARTAVASKQYGV